MTEIYKTKNFHLRDLLDTMFLNIWLLRDKMMVSRDFTILLSSYLEVPTVKTALKNHRNTQAFSTPVYEHLTPLSVV